AGLCEGAPHDGGDLALEHPGGVGRGLLAAQLAALDAEDQGYASEVGNTGGEGDPRARGRLVEDHGDGLRTGEWLLGEPVSLELQREFENLVLLGLAEVVVAQEVAGHGATPFCTASSVASKSSRNSDTSASPTIRG